MDQDFDIGGRDSEKPPTAKVEIDAEQPQQRTENIVNR
jgi:hypothetical protein